MGFAARPPVPVAAAAGDGAFSCGKRLGWRGAGAARRRRVVPLLLPAPPRRRQRCRHGRAAAAGGCRPLCRGRGDPARARAQRARGAGRRPGERLSADRGFRRRHLHPAAAARRRRARPLRARDRRAGGAAACRSRRANPDLPPYDEERLLAEAALLVDWYLPAVLGVPPSIALREEYLALWRAVLPLACEPFRPTLVLRDFHVDNLMLLPGRPGRAALRAARFSGRGRRPARLRSRLAAGRCAARRARGAAPGDDRALSRRLSGARPRGFRAFRGHPRGPAQLQDPRHLHPAVEARRQARLSRPHPAAVAAARGTTCATRRSRGIARWLDRHLPPAVRRMPDLRGRRDRAAAPGDGAGGRARDPAAPGDRHTAEAAGRAQRAHPARSCDRPAGEPPASSMSSSTPITWRR